MTEGKAVSVMDEMRSDRSTGLGAEGTPAVRPDQCSVVAKSVAPRVIGKPHGSRHRAGGLGGGPAAERVGVHGLTSSCGVSPQHTYRTRRRKVGIATAAVTRWGWSR